MFKHEAPAVTGAPTHSGARRQREYSPATLRASTGRPIYCRNRLCGHVVGDVFERRFDPKLHVLRRLRNALSFHHEVLEQLQALGVEWIHATPNDNPHFHYWVLLAELQRDGTPVRDPRYGDQLALPLSRWQQTRKAVKDDTTDERPPAWGQSRLL